MFNIILLPNERRNLTQMGYYFLEEQDFLILKNKYDQTLFELCYCKEINRSILMLEDVCYYFTGIMMVEMSKEMVHVHMNWYATRNDDVSVLKDGKFIKAITWGVWIEEEKEI